MFQHRSHSEIANTSTYYKLLFRPVFHNHLPEMLKAEYMYIVYPWIYIHISCI